MKTIDRQSSVRHRSPDSGRQVLAWQGLELSVPRLWNAVKIEGDFRAGMILLADLESARLGLRWATAPKSKRSGTEIVNAAMREEVGELAARAANPATAAAGGFTSQSLFVDPEPPARDVWIGLSDVSRRLVQLSYQAKTRDGVLAHDLLPTLAEQTGGGSQRWAVLDLSCEVPAGLMLHSHHLSAGDLRLSFTESRRRRISVRQIGPATLALARQPLEKWLAAEVAGHSRLYRSGAVTRLRLEGFEHGCRQTLARRRRAFLHRALPVQIAVCGLHDAARNRIILLQAENDDVLQQLARSVGWATPPRVGE